MSTRAMYRFLDGQDVFTVYVHCDGYPSGALEKIEAALPYAWKLPRFEADEFAAAFVAANKRSSYHDRVIKAFESDTAAERKKHVKLAEMFKTHDPGGNVRLVMVNGIAPAEMWRQAGDIRYRYDVRELDGDLYVKCLQVSCPGDDVFDPQSWSETELFSGTLAKFRKWVEKK